MGRRFSSSFQPAWWLRNPHAQTIWGKVARRRAKVHTGVECVTAPDGDNLELHHLMGPEEPSTRLLLLHGLEGSSQSHYVGGLLRQAEQRGWGATLMMFRGCGSAPNTARRFYHSGETGDVAYVFDTLAARRPECRWVLAAVSLGANVLLKWLGEMGDGVDKRITAAAAVSAPFDLDAGARHISRGFARVYDRNFVRSLKRKAMAKLARYPDLFDGTALQRARTVYGFDDVVTAPVHGFADARDYYARSSAIGYLDRIRVRTLLLSAVDDPFLPGAVLDRVEEIAAGNPALHIEFSRRGGHVGFVGGRLPWKPVYHAERRVFEFFDAAMEARGRTGYD